MSGEAADGKLAHGITREVLEADGLRKALLAEDPTIETVPDDALRASIASMLENAADANTNGVWFFAYGSLLWNPCVAVAEWRQARLYGYHRDFRLRLEHGRGSQQAPALMLGLVPGGSCRGMVLRLDAENLAHEMLMIWRREMVTGVYRPCWVRVAVGDQWLNAVTFVVEQSHASYCGCLPDRDVVELLATGQGTIGTAQAYLENTVNHLDELGIHDRRLSRLNQQVNADQQRSKT